MFDCGVGDSLFAMPEGLDSAHSDFQGQVGDTKVSAVKTTANTSMDIQSLLNGLKGACSQDFQCQADLFTSELQFSLKTGQPDGSNPLELSLPLETCNRSANKCRNHIKSTETRGHTKTSSSASQCNILTSCTSADFQCQAGKGFFHKIKVSASADFQCQASVTHLDFQCQFNDNASGQ